MAGGSSSVVAAGATAPRRTARSPGSRAAASSDTRTTARPSARWPRCQTPSASGSGAPDRPEAAASVATSAPASIAKLRISWGASTMLAVASSGHLATSCPPISTTGRARAAQSQARHDPQMVAGARSVRTPSASRRSKAGPKCGAASRPHSTAPGPAALRRSSNLARLSVTAEPVAAQQLHHLRLEAVPPEYRQRRRLDLDGDRAGAARPGEVDAQDHVAEAIAAGPEDRPVGVLPDAEQGRALEGAGDVARLDHGLAVPRVGAEAARVRRVFELFVETGSGVETVRRLQAEGVTAKSGRPLDKGDVYKILNLRTYNGEVTHRGNIYRGEHQAIVPRDLWDRAHAILQVSPRKRAAQNRQLAPALLKGLIYGVDGRALSPTHCEKKGRHYRYYVAQRVLKGDANGDSGIVRRVPAAEIEGAVIAQVRALLRQPEIVVGTWLAARKEAPDLTEREVRDALHRLDPLWDELFPAEQAQIVHALVERVTIGPEGADIRLCVEGLAGLVHDLGAMAPVVRRAA